MKIISIEPSVCEEIEIEGTEWTYYRRYPSGSWEVLMGGSWEPVYDDAELEQLYKEYSKT